MGSSVLVKVQNMEKKTRQGDNGENVKCQKAMKDYFLNDRVFLQLCT